MAGVATFAVVQRLASGGSATQKALSEQLGLSQTTVSRILRETPGIIKNDTVIPAEYSFDASDSVASMSTDNSSNYTGVTRPDGSILLDGRWYAPQPDTMAKIEWPAMAAKCNKIMDDIISAGGFGKLDKKSLKTAAGIFDQIAITIHSRLAKGDFDGTNH